MTANALRRSMSAAFVAGKAQGRIAPSVAMPRGEATHSVTTTTISANVGGTTVIAAESKTPTSGAKNANARIQRL